MSETQSTTAYVACLSVMGEPREINISLADYAGLVSWYATASPPGRLVTLWISGDSFLKHRDVLCVRLGLQVEWSDVIRTAGTPKVPFLRRIAAYQAVVGLAALITAGVVIQSKVRDMVQEPDLVVKVGVKDRLEQLEKTPFRADVAMINNTGTAHRNVKIQATLHQAGRTYRLTVVPSTMKLIDAGATKDIVLGGNEVRPGDYTLVIEGTAVAGIIHGEGKFKRFEKAVHVFRENPRVIKGPLSPAAGSARLAATLEVGRDATDGLDCALYLRGHPEIKDVRIDFPSMKELLPVAAGGEGEGIMRRFRWKTKSMHSLHTQEFSAVLLSDPGITWQAIPAAIDLRCDEN